MSADVVLVHDYLTQRGGAERVVLDLLAAFPGAPIYTSLYSPGCTFPEFQSADVRPLGLNRFGLLRHHHRLSLPVLAPSFGRLHIRADVAICSSSGWAHGARVSGRKIVYCHTPARWLYLPDVYLRSRAPVARTALRLLGPPLRAWDRRAALTADRYLATSTTVRERIRTAYGIEAELLPPPPGLDPSGPEEAIPDIEPGFFLCVARLLPYKNVQAVLGAFAGLPDEKLVVVGAGPERARLEAVAPANATLLTRVGDSSLRWLYRHCAGTVAASWEDYGLTPLEAATFGRPSAVLRAGGYLDTVVEQLTGVFFDAPTAPAIRTAVERLREVRWDEEGIRDHAREFSRERFVARLRALVAGLMEP